MIEFDKPVYSRPDGTFVVMVNGYPYHVTENTKEALDELQSYILLHPEVLIPEPVPPEPTAEELRQQEISQLLSYLSSTDWYATRLAETNTPIPTDIKIARQSARDRISELRT